ncbi:MAG: hypothetical protein KatS3mg010_1079 [Acidimicrobiia bacterium]|nr:MAG: hypothetical protein KatS3mg010_1079 [Acidimicrobiia bacterium]
MSAATTMSQASTISKPPASAGPFTAAIRGFGKSRVTIPANPPFTFAISFARPDATTFRSAPAQKTSPAPVTTTARTSSSASTASRCAIISRLTSGLIALRASGRLRVRRAVAPRRSSSTSAMEPDPIGP